MLIAPRLPIPERCAESSVRRLRGSFRDEEFLPPIALMFPRHSVAVHAWQLCPHFRFRAAPVRSTLRFQLQSIWRFARALPPLHVSTAPESRPLHCRAAPVAPQLLSASRVPHPFLAPCA